MLNHDQTRKEPQQFGLLQAANTCTPSADGILPVRSFIPERKYEQIMSCTENDLHPFTAAACKVVVDRSAAELVVVGNYSIRHKRKSSSSSNPGDVEEYHRKTISKKAKRLTRSSSSPGSNSSDVTTEQYMAESSKSSSCFDDACTLAPDQAPPPADAADAAASIVPHAGPPEETIDINQSGASTLTEPIHHKSCNDDDQDHQVLDLNGVPVLIPQQQQQQQQTAEIGNFSRHQMVDLLLKSEESELLGINRRSFMNQGEAAGECIEYYSSSNSWLQLGLGLSSSSRSPEVLPKTTTAKPHELLVAEHSAAEEDEEADVSRQQKQVLHLFPSESVQISEEYARTPGQALASKQLISASTSSARSGEIDQRLAIASSDFHSLGRFGKAAAEESRSRQQELTGFLKSLKEGPDTELMISYNNNTSTSTAGYAGHAADDHQLQFRQQIRSQPPSISSSARLIMNSFGDQSYYQESASDQVQHHRGYASTSSYDQFNVSVPQQQQQQLQQPFEDSKHSIQRGYNSAAAKSRSQQQDSSHLWPKRDQSLTTPYFTPSRAPDVFVPMQAASPFHTAASRLNLPSHQQPEDWQTLIKRLGGSNMQFQSFFNPGLAKASADGFLEDMQQQRRRNLQDLQAHWNSTSQEAAARSISISHASAAAGSGAAAPWSRQLLAGGGQDISMKTTMPFSFPSFDGLSFSSRVAAPNLQAWPPSAAGSLLPFLPNISHDQQQQQQQQHQFFPDHLTTIDQRRKLTPVKDHDIWFFLRAGAANQDSERLLPQIPKGYLRVKDGGTVPVSHVKKYLVHKLGLSCESEVEISCRGHILSSSLSLQHVRDVIWHSSTATTATTAEETSSSRNIVMELNYSKRLLQLHHS